jgi:hypothetical protein
MYPPPHITTDVNIVRHFWETSILTASAAALAAAVAEEEEEAVAAKDEELLVPQRPSATKTKSTNKISKVSALVHLLCRRQYS